MRPAVPLAALGNRTFRSLRRHRDYRLYFVGNGISFIGTWMQQIAAYWLVHLRGRAASLYFFAFMGGAPLGGLVAGSLTAHGGTRLAFAFAGTMALVVVPTGAAVLLAGRRAAAVTQSTREVEA